MTDTQPRDGDSTGDDEPLSSLKAGRTRCSEETSSGFTDDISAEKTCKEPPCTADAEEERSDSDDDKPLIMTNKSKKKQKPAGAEPATPDSKKTRNPRKRNTGTTASPVRKTSSSRVKVTQKRGMKGQQDGKKKPSANPPSETRRRGRSPRKTNKAPSADSSDDDESLIQCERKKKHPQMKRAVVLLERLSQRAVDRAIARRRPNHPERGTAGSDDGQENSDDEPLTRKVKKLKEQSKPRRRRKPAADSSSDDEPLGKKVKTLKMKDKRRKAANGNKDADNQGKEQSDSDERQSKKKSE